MLTAACQCKCKYVGIARFCRVSGEVVCGASAGGALAHLGRPPRHHTRPRLILNSNELYNYAVKNVEAMMMMFGKMIVVVMRVRGVMVNMARIWWWL